MAKSGNDNDIILDRFSDANLIQWKRLSDLSEEYHVRLFYHLESLRTLYHKELCDALLSSQPSSIFQENWWRIVDLKYSNSPLCSQGSLKKGGRFNIGNDLGVQNFKPFPVLYIAENEDTAQNEKFGAPVAANGLTNNELALRSKSSYAAVRLRVEINNAFDLTGLGNLTKFTKIISSFHLTSELKELAKELRIKPPYLVNEANQLRRVLLANNWRYYPVQHGIPANSQLFGRMLKDSGFEAVIYPSARLPGGKNVGVFCENFDRSCSFVELQDKAPNVINCSRLDSESWKTLA